jgi:WD40 repeat protein
VARADQGDVALTGGGWQYLRDGSGFADGTKDFDIRLWDLNKGKVIRRFRGHQGPVQSLAFCPDGRHFVSGSCDRSVRLWNLKSGHEVRVLGWHDKSVPNDNYKEWGVQSVAVSPDGRSCVSGGFDCKLRFWRMPTNEELAKR